MDRKEEIRKFLIVVSNAPPTQIAPEAADRLRALCDDISSGGMKAILDDCARYSLASDFAMVAMVAMDAAWKSMVKAGL